VDPDLWGFCGDAHSPGLGYPGSPGTGVAGQAVTGVLGWRGGDWLPLSAEARVAVARRDPRGMVTMPTRACVAIPAILRRRAAFGPGDGVLLAAVSPELAFSQGR